MAAIRSAIGVSVPDFFVSRKIAIQIPPHPTATILFDQGELTNAFVHLLFSDGKGATITCTYAEALFEKDAFGQPTLQKRQQK